MATVKLDNEQAPDYDEAQDVDYADEGQPDFDLGADPEYGDEASQDAADEGSQE
jgi:hypothetical protein